jgi:hypothetical protein
MLWLFPVLLIVLAGVMLLVFFFSWKIFYKASGWPAMAKHYHTTQKPETENLITRQTIAVGAVRYRSCVTVACLPKGLYLSIWFSPALLIPWDEINSVQPTLLYCKDAMQLSFGSPQLGTATFYIALYEKIIRSHLKPDPPQIDK